jgi:hypothetical protein
MVKKMKNEMKLNILEQTKEIKEIVELYQTVMAFGDRNKQRDLDSQTMQRELTPATEKLHDTLMGSSSLATNKDELSKAVEYLDLFTEKVDQFVKDELGIEKVLLHLIEFRSYIDGLVEKDEQLHTTAVGQGSSAKSAKETSTVGNKRN